MDSVPTRWSAAVFATKASLLRAQRAFVDLNSPATRHPQTKLQLPFSFCQSTTPLWTDSTESEQWYQRGKVRNLALAAQKIDGCLIPPDGIFSFWKQVGRATSERGFQAGRMLQEGCLIASIGGGICQLSNALFQVALDSGCEILERHSHSRLVPGSATALNRDATVAWNYIDLRFRVPDERQLSVKLTDDHLIVAMHGRQLHTSTSQPHTVTPLAQPIGAEHACDTCGESRCFRYHP